MPPQPGPRVNDPCRHPNNSSRGRIRQQIHLPLSAVATNDGFEVLRIALGTEADNNGIHAAC
jgi:hypothetical protein